MNLTNNSTMNQTDQTAEEGGELVKLTRLEIIMTWLALCPVINKEVVAFISDTKLLKLMKINCFFGIISSIISLALDKETMSIVSDSYSIFAGIVSLLMYRHNRLIKRNDELVCFEIGTFVVAFIIHLTGALVVSFYIAYLDSRNENVTYAVLNLLYHIIAIVAALIMMLYRVCKVCCCRNLTDERETIVDRKQRTNSVNKKVDQNKEIVMNALSLKRQSEDV